jgi:formiminoglutamase
MSNESSSEVAWFGQLDPADPPTLRHRADDPRLGEMTEFWTGDRAALRPGRAVLIGFPQDEGVRRNDGRVGASQAPTEIRKWLYRLTPWQLNADVDLAQADLLDVGNVRIEGSLEDTQATLGRIVGELLKVSAFPIILGGGHETAYGHYLGYVAASRPVAIINLDAHLDVRPLADGLGHSGSPFRQAIEHASHPLPGHRYTCIGASNSGVARNHYRFVKDRGGCVIPQSAVEQQGLATHFESACRAYHSQSGSGVMVSLDADLAHMSDVPGVSAPNVHGVPGRQLIETAFLAGRSPGVTSFDLVEINPVFDRDGQSARWASLVIWNLLAGLVSRPLGTNG